MAKHVHAEASANNTKRHVHADVIKAWADGAEIEYKSTVTPTWTPITSPTWVKDVQYRVKPKQQERWFNIYNDSGFSSKEEAEECSKDFRMKPIACVKIVFTEGDGL